MIGSIKEVYGKLLSMINDRDIVIIHGGEPLLLPLNDLRSFLSHKLTTRALQTNLTLLTDEHIQLFKEHRTVISASFDGLGRLGRNRQLQDVVYSNIQKLKAERVHSNIITVLSKSNAGSREDLDELWDQLIALDCNVKFNYGIGYDQLDPEAYAEVAFYLFKKSLPLMFEKNKEVRPFSHYLENCSGLLPIPNDCSFSGCQRHKSILGIMPNGDATICCRYTESPILGNIFENSLEEIVENPVREKYLRH